MKIYLVGGAVRDQLLKLPVKEKDWVVVGATAQEMQRLGYRQVGKDFPVFLHPQTNEEYALARTERKVSRGYTGFTFDTSDNVTLEEDLRRRDLTINAMAMDGKQLIDPYDGKTDLKQKILRHVSSAFIEDPVRILRVARFAARFGRFKVADATNKLMKKMVRSGEVDALVPERVWKEWERALSESYPKRFFEVLEDCGALSVLFPELEITDVSMKALAQQEQTQTRFAALLQALPLEKIAALCDRYRVPNEYRDLALLAAKYLNEINRAKKLSAPEIVDLLQATDAMRREDRFKQLLLLTKDTNATHLLNCLQAIKQIDVQSFSEGLIGKQIAERLHQERIEQVAKKLKK